MSQPSDKPAPPPPRLSATIMLVRDQPSFEVLMVKRHASDRLCVSRLVFPGGKTEAADSDDVWAERVLGWDRFDAAERALRIAAIREAYEEAGILLARTADGAVWAGAHEAVEARSAVARGEASSFDLAVQFGLKLDLEALTPFARWITPVMMPKRFDTHFSWPWPPRINWPSVTDTKPSTRSGSSRARRCRWQQMAAGRSSFRPG
jgi:8-oxo-dGTP pyrophosphatase MutT (NUDIX family)